MDIVSRDLTARSVPISDPSVSILITNSNVKHQLTGSEYPERRAACLDSARVMGVDSLRDVTMDTVDTFRDQLDEVTYRRVKHVVTEIERLVSHFKLNYILVSQFCIKNETCR